MIDQWHSESRIRWVGNGEITG